MPCEFHGQITWTNYTEYRPMVCCSFTLFMDSYCAVYSCIHFGLHGSGSGKNMERNLTVCERFYDYRCESNRDETFISIQRSPSHSIPSHSFIYLFVYFCQLSLSLLFFFCRWFWSLPIKCFVVNVHDVVSFHRLMVTGTHWPKKDEREKFEWPRTK